MLKQSFIFFGAFFLMTGLIFALIFITLCKIGGFYLNIFLFSFQTLEFSFSFLFDSLSFSFFSVVALVSGTVFIYSNFYMDGSANNRRFFLLVAGFVTSMFLLVFSGNFLVTMVGWDGLGLVSFCLVVYYNSSKSLDSGLITVLTNRMGDVCFLVSFFFFFVANSWDYSFFYYSWNNFLILLIFLGAVTKSAQIPFASWLPAAMAAPTPVSALVHSSTLVTAGIYVLIRYHFFCWEQKTFFFFLGLLTMLVAGVCACFEKDFKKVIAMSTLSQLGLMVFSIALNMWNLAFFHMMTHAFFKSMLFLSCGGLIHQMGGTQDYRFYGGMENNQDFFLFFLISSLSLIGFPFLVGFYSKDVILGSMGNLSALSTFFIFSVSCLFTVFYGYRLVEGAFLKSYKHSNTTKQKINMKSFFSILNLFFMCLFLGGFLSEIFLPCCVFFSVPELILGLMLILLGVVVKQKPVKVQYVNQFFCKISFLQWISTGGASMFMKVLFFNSLEKSWMETFGGRGSFNTIFFFNSYVLKFSEKSLKLGLSALFLSILYFLCA